MLATWLQQKTWELYLNDVKKVNSSGSVEGVNPGFVEDI